MWGGLASWSRRREASISESTGRGQRPLPSPPVQRRAYEPYGCTYPHIPTAYVVPSLHRRVDNGFYTTTLETES